MTKKSIIDDVKTISFARHTSDEANLYVYEYEKHVPFLIKRVFNVDALQACERGAHAHKDCIQLLVCLRGCIDVIVDDGHEKSCVTLDSPDKGILIPSGLWAEQKYAKDSLLMVLTDQLYDETDYIRNYDDFIKYKGDAE